MRVQIVSTGLLAQNSSSSACPAWTADFCAACSAAYLSLQPSMHTSMSQALMGCPTSSFPSSNSLPKTSTGADATADNVTLLAQSQTESDQPVLPTSESARQQHGTSAVKVGQLGRIRAAWGATPKHNSVTPMPLPGPCSSSLQISDLDADAHQLQDCCAPGRTLTETAVALDRCYSWVCTCLPCASVMKAGSSITQISMKLCYSIFTFDDHAAETFASRSHVDASCETVPCACSGLEELQWHKGMLQRWPAALCSAYALAILLTAGHRLQSLQLAPASPQDTTVQQLCHSLGHAADLMELASHVHQTSVEMQQSAEVQSLVLQWHKTVFRCVQLSVEHIPVDRKIVVAVEYTCHMLHRSCCAVASHAT